ncbi:uncharacterized protein LOC144439120 isoform X1 [Glandiceps talaboti]
MDTTTIVNYAVEEYASGELRYNGSEANKVVMTMPPPVGNITTTPLIARTSEGLFSDDIAVPQNFTISPEMVSNETDARLSLSNFTIKYANNSTLHFRTQVSMTTDAMRCCSTTNGTSTNSTNTEMSSDDALGPVIAGLCTAVGLLLCLWLICFAIEKRIHSRKRAVERHYLPQSRSYPIQVAEMRKALRTWETGSERNSRRSYPWSSKRRSREDSGGEPNCIVPGRYFGGFNTPSITVTSASPEPPPIALDGEVKVEPTANGFPGSSIRICKSAPTIAVTSFHGNNSCTSSDADDDNLTSDNLSEDSVIKLDFKPNKRYLTVGDPYNYIPLDVHEEEVIEDGPRKAVGNCEMQVENEAKNETGATNNIGRLSVSGNRLSPASAVPGLQVPGLQVPGLQVPGLQVPGLQVPGVQVPGLRLQLEIDESQCLKR